VQFSFSWYTSLLLLLIFQKKYLFSIFFTLVKHVKYFRRIWKILILSFFVEYVTPVVDINSECELVSPAIAFRCDLCNIFITNMSALTFCTCVIYHIMT